MADSKTQVRPVTGASIAVFCGEEVLLIRRNKSPFKGAWSLPGGTQEAGERLEETACRELAEETGLVLVDPEFAMINEPIVHENGQLVAHFVLAVFRAELGKKVEPVAGDDAGEARWMKIDEIERLETTPRLREIIQDIIQKADLKSPGILRK